MTTDLTTLLAEADAVSAAATPGPWIDGPFGDVWADEIEKVNGLWREKVGITKPRIIASPSRSVPEFESNRAFIAASRDLIPRLVAACREQMAEIERLREDRRRLDYLDEANRRLNAKYGTSYKWKLIMNHNVNRLMLGAGKVDLNDMEANGLPSCREAIDSARAALQPAGKDTP